MDKILTIQESWQILSLEGKYSPTVLWILQDRKYVGKKATSSYPILPKRYESKRARHFLTKGGLLLPFERKFENTLALLVLNLS